MRRKIDLSTLSDVQKDALLQHLDSHLDAITESNNTLIERLAPTSEKAAEILNEWSAFCSAMSDASGRKILEICGLADDGSKPTLN